jgi:hypothetical protein
MDVPAKYNIGSRKSKSGCYDAPERNKEGQVADDIDYVCINEV